MNIKCFKVQCFLCDHHDHLEHFTFYEENQDDPDNNVRPAHTFIYTSAFPSNCDHPHNITLT